MNLNITTLKNRYYGFRHGQSMANVEGIIVSDPSIGIVRYGLSDVGRKQVTASAKKLQNLAGDAMLVSSDFLRAAETAEIIRSTLALESIQFDVRLRERYFGAWEGKCYLHYKDAWEKDEINSDLEMNGAESANSVRLRLVELIHSLERRYAGRNVILVSHGDPLRLLQTAFLGLATENNGTVSYFDIAECRLLDAESMS